MHQILRTLPLEISGSQDLYAMVRAAFVARNTSPSAWCKVEAVNRQKALEGLRRGKRASALRHRLVDDLFTDLAA